jgi:tRNA pseudouridine38-40 synthase
VVYDASWHRDRQFHVFRITANRFLRSMVRFLVAGMVESGMGRLDPDEFTFMLGSGIRAVPLVPAASNGLFLWKIVYA